MAGRNTVGGGIVEALEEAMQAGREKKYDEFKRRGRLTNWNKNGEVSHEKRAYMMGEGYGNCLGLEGPKYTVWTVARKTKENVEPLEEAKKLARQEKAAATRRRNQKRKQFLQAKIDSEGALVGQRIFNITWSRKEWERRAKVYAGGLPQGVDVAYSDYGDLLMVPVIEEDDAKEMGLHKVKVPKEHRLKDIYGRQFWVSAELKNILRTIFGNINWKRPLTIEEAKQFGVEVL